MLSGGEDARRSGGGCVWSERGGMESGGADMVCSVGVRMHGGVAAMLCAVSRREDARWCGGYAGRGFGVLMSGGGGAVLAGV